MNLRDFLEESTVKFGGRIAVVCNETRLSFSDLDKSSNKIANYLLKKGINKGDRVAILLPNIAEFAIVYLGAVKTGATCVPLDPKYKLEELDSLFGNIQPSFLIAESECLAQILPALSRFPSIKQVTEVGSQFKGKLPNLEEILATESARKITIEVDADTVAHIGYTSGPTSRPKGVMLTHRTMIEEAWLSADTFRETENDAMMLFALPMHHVFGLVVGLLATLVKGSKVVILPGLSLTVLFEQIEKEKGTLFIGVPYIFALMVHMAEQDGIKNDISSMRHLFCGGNCLPDKIALRFRELYGLPIGNVYGLTEGTGDITCTPLDETPKLGSAGRLVLPWKLKIVDEAGNELPRNQSGEIWVKGPIMKGYYNNPEATAKTITDGWLHTGDLGKIGDDGELYIMGLKKKMIIVKGQNIWPEDIEKVLYQHPKVAEAVMVGVPDELRNETVGAAVKLKDGETTTEEEIKRFCRQHLINYKIPRRILIVNTLPKTADGQVQREAIIAELLKLQAASSPLESQLK